MARFDPITIASQLPAVGASYERSTLDFKKTSSAKPTQEQAKDVAAFANRFGGTLLIGFEERSDGRVGNIEALPSTHAANVKSAISQAVRDRCRPSPTVDVDIIDIGEAACVLAVNVSPFFGQPVGVIAGDLGREPAYLFPFRTMTDTRFLQPQELPMFFDARFRRTVVLLAAVPSCEAPTWHRPRIRFVYKNPTNGMDNALQLHAAADFVVDEDRNVVRFDMFAGENDTATFAIRVPLEDIESVWQSSETEWCALARGWLRTDKKLYTPLPSNAQFTIR